VFVEPFSWFFERRNSVSCTLADANHRDDQENERGKSENGTARGTASNGPDGAKQQTYCYHRELQRESLCRMSAHSDLSPRHEDKLQD